MEDKAESRSDVHQPVESIVELFHMVKSLIPDGQKVVAVNPETRVADALAVMEAKRYSQLPVVSGNAVLGVFSYRSLSHKLAELGPITTDFRDLPVDEFMEPFAFVQPMDKWESTLDHLDKKDGVLVGNRNRLQGILTAWDVLTYLDEIASPFVLLAEIELSLRRIIEASIDEEQFRQCALNSLAKKYDEESMPASVSDMEFNDYVQIVGNGRNWPLFEAAFGKGEWLRKQTVARLKEVRDLRNDVFHFRRQMEEIDNKTLVKHRDWLEMKSRSFEGRRQEIIVDPAVADSTPVVAKTSRGTTNAALYEAFFTDLLARLKEQTPGLTRSRKASPRNYWGFSAGRSGLSFGWTFVKGGQLRTELYINTRDKDRNKQIFDRLVEEKEVIEKEFDGDLEWQRADEQRYSRIYSSIPAAIRDDPAELEEAKTWALKNLQDLVDVFQKRINKLPV